MRVKVALDEQEQTLVDVQPQLAAPGDGLVGLFFFARASWNSTGAAARPPLRQCTSILPEA
jgi:hypothetical protein